MSPFKTFLTICLAALLFISSVVDAKIQITHPAPKGNVLELNPTPYLRWVYGNEDPPTIGILIQQVHNDVHPINASLYRPDTPTNWTSVNLIFEASDIKMGMFIKIYILDQSNTEVIADMKILDETQPLYLGAGHTGIIPMGNETMSATEGAANASSTSSDAPWLTVGPTINGSITGSANDTIAPSSTAQSTVISTEFFSSSTVTITRTPTATSSASATSTTTSEADSLFQATAVYMVALLLLAIPAFIAGFNS